LGAEVRQQFGEEAARLLFVYLLEVGNYSLVVHLVSPPPE
jgi:hypothetical protein